MHMPASFSICAAVLYALTLGGYPAYAIELNINDEQSIKDAAATATWQMMTYYHGNETGQIPGAFPEKWWEGSALFYALLNYWHFTGDETYNDELSVGLQFQSGTNGDYLPSNYSHFLGNDDQMFWGLAAMTAAELKFPDVKDGFSWLSLAQGVFNSQKGRWNTTMCGGGLTWQMFPYQGGGYTMKNAISNGGFFQLAARLARYTGESEYETWAKKTWDWSVSVPLVNNKTWLVQDSTEGTDGCINGANWPWTYNYGTYMMGVAYMYNYTGDPQWYTALDGLLNRTFSTFFLEKHGGIMEDILCEAREICNNNEVLFKGLLSTWFSYIALIVPSTYDRIMPKLQTAAVAAAASCNGEGKNICGVRWYESKFDGNPGMEQQISVSQVLSANLLPFVQGQKSVAPVTSSTGGNSESNPDAGLTDPIEKKGPAPISTGDRAGAGILTVVLAVVWAAMMAYAVI
ncbi:putative mannan endo-1,6-alpha-mannosidase [Penicillium oxalicum]|uniref:Mannan endo-1,6-alpha-mannosidase n=1 Tax=Penicillium oxalicum (strain 114-2 / CGMCC 5302) TaxID=933388 RepID=S7ZNC9_PENO1|nr:putative mannan endo-1,6-alpha-mannosidase [Penicillium oxalicum]EPS31824.1 putative alpha-1,6-mannanase [Penicillium oxalicum 114-2]KAI2790467.1 putative mannan endo-1,6-alpha-mannosidase [Penicillium oxalicum]